MKNGIQDAKPHPGHEAIHMVSYCVKMSGSFDYWIEWYAASPFLSLSLPLSHTLIHHPLFLTLTLIGEQKAAPHTEWENEGQINLHN